jgi:hypothetical protein
VLQPHGTDVMTFHELCGSAAQRTGVLIDQDATQQKRFDDLLPAALADACASRHWTGYDTIIVDEGQDFMSHWWPALDAARAGAASHFYVFYDDNQNVYGGARGLPADIQARRYPLSLNMRNTKRIHSAASRHYAGSPVQAVGPEGVDVHWISAPCRSALEREMLRLVRRLAQTEGVAAEETAVLCVSDADIAPVMSVCSEAGIEGASLDGAGAGRMTVDTIRRFKGLERPVIIIAADDAIRSSPELVYVAMSRARTALFVIGSEAAQKVLKAEAAQG